MTVQKMKYRISRITGEPRWDSLEVAKITNYPLEPRDYKPFAQGIICISDGTLSVRLWAFEVAPMATSRVLCALYPFKTEPDTALVIDVHPLSHPTAQAVSLSLVRAWEEKPLPLADMGAVAMPHTGEDLQGVYWGATISIPLGALGIMGGELATAAGDVISGNFFKLCDDAPYIHRGSHFPADFTLKTVSKANMGKFEVVEY